jgi:hypothetical protein
MIVTVSLNCRACKYSAYVCVAEVLVCAGAVEEAESVNGGVGYYAEVSGLFEFQGEGESENTYALAGEKAESTLLLSRSC